MMADEEGPPLGFVEQLSDQGRCSRVNGVAGEIGFVDRLAVDEIVTIVDGPAEGRIGGNKNREFEMQFTHDRLEFRGNLAPEDGIGLFVDKGCACFAEKAGRCGGTASRFGARAKAGVGIETEKVRSARPLLTLRGSLAGRRKRPIERAKKNLGAETMTEADGTDFGGSREVISNDAEHEWGTLAF